MPRKLNQEEVVSRINHTQNNKYKVIGKYTGKDKK